MNNLFFISPTHGKVHILPYQQDNGLTGWFVGTKEYPVMETFLNYSSEDTEAERSKAIYYAVKELGVTEEFLTLFCLALNNGNPISPDKTPNVNHFNIIIDIKNVLASSVKLAST